MRHHIFYSRLSVSKSIFYVSLGNIFLLFLWRPPSCGGRGQLPSLPFLKSGPEHTIIITETTPQPEPHFDQSSRFCTARGRDGRWSANLEHTTANKWLANFDERPHRSGRSFMGAGPRRTTNWTELNWSDLRPVDPVTRCVHWSRLVETSAEIHIIAFAR